jgi:hypothetical protein
MTDYPDHIRIARKLLEQRERINELEAQAAAWTSEAIIAKLAAKFGPHKAYVSATRTYEPDANDAEGSCIISELREREEVWLHLCGDGPCDCTPEKYAATELRALTYGEIADALTKATP